MFSSVARDLSDFGVKAFDSNVIRALNRKGGDLVAPGLEDDRRRQAARKQRGRKNKYYRQIDHEDDQEANHVTDETERERLDGIREEDDDDEEEAAKRRLEQEAAREGARRAGALEADQLRKEKAGLDLRKELTT